MPVLQDSIKKIVSLDNKMDLSRTLNSQECVAKGCAIASAEAVGQYKAKSLEYQIIEYNHYDIFLEGSNLVKK
mgnify:CR=1 FL=1